MTPKGLTAVCMALCGIALVYLTHSYYQAVLIEAWISAAVIGLIIYWRGLPGFVTGALTRICGATERRAISSTAVLAMAGCAFIYGLAVYQGRPLYPRFHDEFAYLLQTRLLASGHVGLSGVPLVQFFDSTYILTSPVYTTQYFLGAPALYVPLMLVGLAPWLMALTVSALALGVAIRWAIAAGGARLGLWVAVLIPASQVFRDQSTSVQAQVATLLAAALVFLLSEKNGKWARTAEVAALAWGCLVRPLDGLCLLMAVAICLFARGSTWRERFGRLLVPLAGGLLAVVVQGGINYAVIGDARVTPFQKYGDVHMPGFALGDSPIGKTISPDVLPQQRDIWRYMWPAEPAFWGEGALRRVGMTLRVGGSVWPVALLAIMGALPALRRERLRLPVVFAVLMLVGYGFYPLFLPHYAVALMPVVAVAFFEGWSVLPARLRPAIAVAILILLGATLAAPDIFSQNTPISEFNRAVEDQVRGPAVILSKYGPGSPIMQEPVYNIETADPWQGRIVKVQDLGPAKNAELLQYLKQNQPDRELFRFDRATGKLKRLGIAKELTGLE